MTRNEYDHEIYTLKSRGGVQYAFSVLALLNFLHLAYKDGVSVLALITALIAVVMLVLGYLSRERASFMRKYPENYITNDQDR